MILIAAIDDRNGMMFNHRRQSRDSAVVNRILSMSSNSTLWVHEYSEKLFIQNGNRPEQLRTDNSLLDKASPGDYCFIENISIGSHRLNIEKIILFKWNRKYPGDFFFDIDLQKEGWKLLSTEDFSGSSHEKITMEVYTR